MSKRGHNPYEKQSSTISNAKVIDLMGQYKFAVQTLDTPIEAKKSVRHAVAEAKRKFGEFAAISATGESILFEGLHFVSKRPVHDIRVKLSNMLGIGEQVTLFTATGIPELNPYPERRVA